MRFLFEFYGKISKIMILYLLLPNESKEVLYKIGFILSTSTSKPPLFNYVTFIDKSINFIHKILIHKDLIVIKSKKSLSW